MKKLLMLFLTLTTLLLTARSESPFNVGLKYGVNSSSLFTNLGEILDHGVEEKSVECLYMAGAFGRVNFGRVYLQPEVYFNSKGGLIITKTEHGSTLISAKNMVDYKSVDVPILLGFKVIDKKYYNIRVNAGPTFSWTTSSDFSTSIENLSYNDIKKRQLGWQAGIGFDLWFITIDGRFESNNNILKSSSQYSAKNSTYMLAIGLKLF